MVSSRFTLAWSQRCGFKYEEWSDPGWIRSGLGSPPRILLPSLAWVRTRSTGNKNPKTVSILFSSRSKRVKLPFHGASTGFDSRRSPDSTPLIEIRSVLMRAQLSLVPGKEIRATSNQWEELPTYGVHNRTNIDPLSTIINPLSIITRWVYP